MGYEHEQPLRDVRVREYCEEIADVCDFDAMPVRILEKPRIRRNVKLHDMPVVLFV
jgi:hypothetical protein